MKNTLEQSSREDHAVEAKPPHPLLYMYSKVPLPVPVAVISQSQNSTHLTRRTQKSGQAQVTKIIKFSFTQRIYRPARRAFLFLSLDLSGSHRRHFHAHWHPVAVKRRVFKRFAAATFKKTILMEASDANLMEANAVGGSDIITGMAMARIRVRTGSGGGRVGVCR